jgi:hypothetical protein
MNQKRVTELSPDIKERIEQIVLEIGKDCDGAKIDYEKEELVVYMEAGFAAAAIPLRLMKDIVSLIEFDGAEIMDK